VQRIILKSKLHRATVTATEIDYEGSIAIDEDLLDRVDILPYEQVHIYNISSGSRFITYVITAERGSGTFSINGAAARLAQINDRIIVAAYGNIDIDKESHEPKVLLLDAANKVVEDSSF
jgi:aspartate 1-decarboxylase